MKKLSLPMLSIITLATAAVSLALRIVSLFFFYDKLGYYQRGAVLPITANIFLGLAIVFLLAASILFINKKRKIQVPDKISQYAALLPAGASIFTAIRAITGSLDGSSVNKYLFFLGALLSAVFFILIFIKKQPFTATVYFGLAALTYVFFLWMHAYFDFFVPINSTDKIFHYLACAGALLLIFSETCTCYGFVKPRLYFFSLFSSVVTLWVGSVSSLVGFLSGAFERYVTLDGDIFFATLAVYATVRLIMLSKAPEELIEEATEAEIAEETENTEKTNEATNNEETQENNANDGK